MVTQEIERDDWATFCTDFSRQHQGDAVTLEEFDTGSGAYIITWDLALESIAAGLNGADTVLITVSETPQRQVKHVITGAAHMNLEKTDEGAAKALQIHSSSGLSLALHVCATGPARTMLEDMFSRREYAADE